MKKSIFFAIALLVIGLAVVTAQDMARLTQLQQEVERIEAAARARGGTYTQQEQQRLLQIQQEMVQAMGGMLPQGQTQQPNQGSTSDLERRIQEAENRNNQNQQDPLFGNTAGWPSANVLRRYGVSLSQPSTDTVVSYTLSGEELTIYFQFRRGSNGISYPPYNTRVQTGDIIKRHIETAVGGGMYRGSVDTITEKQLPDPQRRNTNTRRYYITVRVNVGDVGDTYRPNVQVTFTLGEGSINEKS